MDTLLTLQQVADILGVSTQTVRRLIRKGQLTGIKSSTKTIRIAPEDLQAFLDNHRTNGDPRQERMKLFTPQKQSAEAK